jgi:hypothetical protein
MFRYCIPYIMNMNEFIGFEALIAVVMKSSIFWNVTPCSPFKFDRCFGGTYRLQLQGGRMSRASNQSESR